MHRHSYDTFRILRRVFEDSKIPVWAGFHHETLLGDGYPFKTENQALDLECRIIAVADIFEALTAKDRPYKEGKTLSEALKIMAFMVKDNKIDKNLFNLFIKEKIYSDYAKRELTKQQIDI